LLHVVDVAPQDGGIDPVADARSIANELKRYDEALYAKARWLVLNKLDLIPADERQAQVAAFVKALRWKGPAFGVSAISGEGCRPLVLAVQAWLDAHPAQAAVAATS